MEMLPDGGLGKPLGWGMYLKWINDLEKTILKSCFGILWLIFATPLFGCNGGGLVAKLCPTL